jgi:hypothetical protein
LPVADRHLIDVGPSYVVVSAIVISLMCGTWLARAAAALDFAVLVFGGRIFSGLSHLDVSAVGHLTAMVTAAALTLILARHRRPVPEGPLPKGPLPEGPLPEGSSTRWSSTRNAKPLRKHLGSGLFHHGQK